MSQSRPSLEEIFETHIQTLALTRRPATVSGYRGAARRFLSFLRTDFPGLSRLSQLRRDPHLLGWLASLSQQQQPLSNKTRANNLLCLRRLLDDLTANGHCLRPELILRQDFPPQPQYLPRPLSPPDDLLLQQQLRRIDDLPANALLLTRATGMNASCQPMTIFDRSCLVFWLCARWPRPRDGPTPRPGCSLAALVMMPGIKLFGWL